MQRLILWFVWAGLTYLCRRRKRRSNCTVCAGSRMTETSWLVVTSATSGIMASVLGCQESKQQTSRDIPALSVSPNNLSCTCNNDKMTTTHKGKKRRRRMKKRHFPTRESCLMEHKNHNVNRHVPLKKYPLILLPHSTRSYILVYLRHLIDVYLFLFFIHLYYLSSPLLYILYICYYIEFGLMSNR